jgi:hypothetical protein
LILKREQRLRAACIAGFGYPLILGLGHTLRWRVEGLNYLDAIGASGRQPVMAFWHGRILPAAFYFRQRGIVVLTSENFDGEWIARIIERLGYGTARGSTSKGGRRALQELTQRMAAGQAAGFTIDGPRGPARISKHGAVWLARATGNPVLPFHCEADSHWTLRSWDQAQIPRPFATVSLVVGKPIEVPREADAKVLEAARTELEARLLDLEIRALQLLT